jgi:hypothetical protein
MSYIVFVSRFALRSDAGLFFIVGRGFVLCRNVFCVFSLAGVGSTAGALSASCCCSSAARVRKRLTIGSSLGSARPLALLFVVILLWHRLLRVSTFAFSTLIDSRG